MSYDELSFQDKVVRAMEQSVLRQLEGGSWLTMEYSERPKIPAGELRRIYELLDWNSLRAKIAERLEAELADRLVNHIAAEVATDVKQILSDKEQREQLRGMARDYIARATKVDA